MKKFKVELGHTGLADGQVVIEFFMELHDADIVRGVTEKMLDPNYYIIRVSEEG